VSNELEIQQAQSRVVRILRETLVELQLKRSGYSIRRFAKKLGIASPVLTQVLNGKRKVTYKFAKKILPSLQLENDALTEILIGLERKPKSPRTGRTLRRFSNHQHVLSAAEFSVISDWWCFGILSLMETEDFRSEMKWIAERLQLTTSAVKKSLVHLEALGLVERVSGEWKPTGKALTTTHDLVDLSIRKHHHQGLDLARDALNSAPVPLRDFNSFTIGFDPARVDEAKEAIDQFMKSFAAEFDVPPRREVYRIQTQLFPLTGKSRTRKEER
jgi:transcriptional regulator with XRE-family HTH domain